MVDLETTGTLPDRTSILQLAAVRFNPVTFEVDHNVFNRSLTMPPHRYWQESTREWWGNQRPEIYQAIVERAEPYSTVMVDFANWAYPINSLRFWSKPSHFDYSFISSYFSDLDIVNPFSFREVNDMNSFLRGLFYPNPVPKVNLDFTGDAHNALADTFHQLKLLFHYLELKKNTTPNTYELIRPTGE